jgi:hypothetical protein
MSELEFAVEERKWVREARKSINDFVEEIFGKHLDFLNEREMRIAKLAQTNGVPSIPLTIQDEMPIPDKEDELVLEAEQATPSLKKERP